LLYSTLQIGLFHTPKNSRARTQTRTHSLTQRTPKPIQPHAPTSKEKQTRRQSQRQTQRRTHTHTHRLVWFPPWVRKQGFENTLLYSTLQIGLYTFMPILLASMRFLDCRYELSVCVCVVCLCVFYSVCVFVCVVYSVCVCLVCVFYSVCVCVL